MKNSHRYVPIILLAAGLVRQALSQDPCGEAKRSLNRISSNGDCSWFTINNIFNWYVNNGSSSENLSTYDSGFEFPKGTGKTAILTDGILWAGFHKGRTAPKLGGSKYRSGLQPGEITGFGGPTESERPPFADTSLAKYRIYRVRPDIGPGIPFDSVRASLEEESILISRYRSFSAQELYDGYVRDWNEWPAIEGLPAPYKDVNANGTFDPASDIPGVPGADQTLYYVANDLDSALTAGVIASGSPPIGLEMHRTIWGYNVPGPLSNALFASTLLINKSGASLDSAFLTQWSDPDLGNSGDDFAGCDPARGLGFVYNGLPSDDEYGTAVPAVGFDFVQGPIVPTWSSGDSAIFRLERRSGYRNIPATSFVLGTCGSMIYNCDPAVDVGWYHIMNGHAGYSGEPFIDPITNLPTRFTVNGDPVTGQGWVDGTFGLHPGDRYLSLATGPFSLANGDTQEVVVATIVGDGADRISSVSVLKHYSDVIQAYFDGLLEIPRPPPSPEVIVGALDQEITLSWSDSAGSVGIERWNSGGHSFEGYNVYQYDGPSADAGRVLRLATYDLRDNVAYIFDDVFEPESGLYVSKPVQFGRDSGIKRSYRTTRDSLNGMPLRNGTPYYFGVTAYTFSSRGGGKPTQTESVPDLLRIVPQWPQGVRYAGVAGDTVKNILHEGPSTGSVVPVVVNPTALPREGAVYRVAFEGSGANQVWHLTRTKGSKTDTLVKSQADQSGSDENAVIVDGIDWRVRTTPMDFRYFLVVANANGPIVPVQQGCFAFNASGFPILTEGADRPNGTIQQSAGLTASMGWGIHTGMNSPRMSPDFEYFKARVTQSGARWGSIVPYDWEMRFTAAGGKALCPSAFGGRIDKVIDVPFELWNTGINTPDDPSDDYRLFPNLMDVDGNFQFNLLAKNGTDSVDLGGGGPDHSISGGDNDPFTDWIYWVQPQDRSPGQAGYNAILAGINAAIAGNQDPYLGSGTDNDVMRRMVIVGWNVGSTTGSGSFALPMPEAGTVFRIVTTKSNSPLDVYTVTVPPADQSSEIAKADADRVNVFPNPFIATRDPKSGAIEQFITFSHLPPRAVIRIYTLAGTLVRSFLKDDVSPFLQWDLKTEYGRVVAPGMYLAYIDMPDVGMVKTLKMCLIAAE